MPNILWLLKQKELRFFNETQLLCLYFYYKDEMHCEYAPIFSQQHIPQQHKAEYSALTHCPL